MTQANNDRYDAVIIGAGMGGLVCGCYLAKAGLKVLITEQHHKPGGYCSSFKRKDFIFDAGAHSFGGYREDGIVRKVFTDLDVNNRVRIRRFDPTDVVITPDYRVSFWADIHKTIEEFQKLFPKESHHIERFFYFLSKPDPISISKIRTWTYQNLLDKYFSDVKLKAILSVPIYGNSGLPPSLLSAVWAAIIFKEFILDSGYYAEGGMQVLPDTLARRFTELGGELVLSCLVEKIVVNDNEVKGILTEGGRFIHSGYVVSNGDAKQTFFDLLGKDIINRDFLEEIDSMVPALSAFIVYLGLDNQFDTGSFNPGINVWKHAHYDLNYTYHAAKEVDLSRIGGYFLHIYPDKKRILAFMVLAFRDKQYWERNKIHLMESFIKKIEFETLPALSLHILYKEAATPYTLHRYTLNQKGSAYGWAGTPSQIIVPYLKKPSFIRGLYLTGHWTTRGFGIPGVLFDGYNTSKILLKKENIVIH